MSYRLAMNLRMRMVLLALGLVPAAGFAAEQVCDRSGSKSTASPDGAWVANVQEEVCSTPDGARAGITVVLSSATNPERVKRVFIMAVPRSRDDWPQIRWPSASAMEVRVPNLAESVNLLEPRFEGVAVTLHYCGDDPAARAERDGHREAVLAWQRSVTAWAAKRKADPDGAGPRPIRPSEPRLAPGRCTD